MQRANLVAVGIAQIGDIELDPGAFANARRILAGLAAIGEAGRLPGVGLRGRIAGETDGAAVADGRGLAVDRLRHREHAGLGAVEDAVAVDRHRIFYRTKTGVFSVSKPIDGKPATVCNGGTIGFACNSPAQAEAWHAAGLANGGKTCEDPPGVREGPGVQLY